MKLCCSHKTKYKWLVLNLLLILVHSGCIPQDHNPTASVTETIVTELAATTLSSTPSPTATVPRSALSPTFTLIPTDTPSVVTPTWTPIPTLSPDVAMETLLALYNGSSSCKLPCWWDITPEKTAWAEAHAKFSPLGRWSGPWGDGNTVRYEYAFDMPEEITPLGYFEVTFGIRRGQVVGISLNSRWIKRDFDYSLAGFLQTLGPPDAVWLNVITDTQHEPHYEMDVLYFAKGILVNTTGIVQVHDEHLLICPQESGLDTFPPALLLWAPEKHFTYSDLFLSVLGESDVNTSDYHLLEEWSLDFDREDFYTTYLDSQTTTCFEVIPIASSE